MGIRTSLIILATFLMKSDVASSSCMAPTVTKCVKVKVKKIIGKFKKYPYSEESCKIEGRVGESNLSKILFVEDKKCSELAGDLIGDLVNYWGCPDGGIGMQKDPTIPGLLIKNPKDCS